MKYDAPNAPYVQARHQGGRQKPTAIILRPSFTNSEDGAALAVAQYWHRSSSFWDAGHYTVDETKRFRCVRDNVIAGRDHIDKGAIRIAMCADPVSSTTFWNDDLHRRVLRNTADLVAELCLAYKIETQYIVDLDEWRRKRKTRRRGGIYVFEPSGWPFGAFQNEVAARRVLKTHI